MKEFVKSAIASGVVRLPWGARQAIYEALRRQMRGRNNWIWLDYPVSPKPRFVNGHPYLLPVFEKARPEFEKFAHNILAVSDELLSIADGSTPGPTFANEYFTGLDAAAYYAAVMMLKPKTLIEIGSGYSTQFARAAIQRNSPHTRLVAIDPSPRADIAALCDQIIRAPLEETDPDVFGPLQAGDILFVDNSHRAFQNSDATVFFVEILPRIPRGVVLQIHDVLLPYDYPLEWGDRYYSEQYLLACWLLANPDRLQLVFSSVFASRDPGLVRKLSNLWDHPRFRSARTQAEKLTAPYWGYSFWTRV